jgi:hypothetical protein
LCFDLSVPIKASSAHRVDALLAELGSDRATARDAAIAGLTVLGPRAVDRLIVLVTTEGPATARAAALGALEAIGDPRAIDTVVAAIDTPDAAVALAAAAAARAFLASPRGAVVVDRLTAALMDTARADALRLAALDTLRALGPSTIAPILSALRRDPRPSIRAAAASDTTATPAERIALAAERNLPERADDLLDALTRAGTVATVPELLQVIEAVRDREATEPAESRARWKMARGRAHVELANRGSRVALYDLRETLEKASSPLPVDFLAALSKAGDASCLEPIADAYERAATDPDDAQLWWRAYLADAFHSISAREGITRRHSVAKRLSKRLGATADALWKTR